MTPDKVLKINVNQEENILTLRELIKYWSDKASELQLEISLIRGLLTPEQVNNLNIKGAKKIE